MDRLIFVYNANSGGINTALDIAHKLLSPSTYRCNLCRLTHDTFTERSAWTSFREKQEIPILFLHKDEYEQQSAPTYPYPVILKEEQGQQSVFLSATDINEITDVNALIATIENRLYQEFG
ncbi:MAG: GTPase [Acaryochloridaceae cyanobacterium SU_2_1]|nr:GTPase [Acaryochloridaceae cyanobacterium SU_2_1]